MCMWAPNKNQFLSHVGKTQGVANMNVAMDK
jgi:hypothetical protein